MNGATSRSRSRKRASPLHELHVSSRGHRALSAQRVHFFTHRLKGAAGNLGVTDVFNSANAIQLSCKQIMVCWLREFRGLFARRRGSQGVQRVTRACARVLLVAQNPAAGADLKALEQEVRDRIPLLENHWTTFVTWFEKEKSKHGL